MALAIFDLDNTLLSGDSDYLWGVFLAERGIVDADFYEQENERFYQEYRDGKLDIMEFLGFSLKPLAEHSPEQLKAWHQQFMVEKIQPLITSATTALVEQHRLKGDTLLIITATNHFVTKPIADYLGIPNLIATDPEIRNGRYTGRVAGTPSFQDGKVTRLNDWLKTQHTSLAGAWFYSDSHNDLSLLETVDNPVAVDPDEKLLSKAQENGWPVISLR